MQNTSCFHHISGPAASFSSVRLRDPRTCRYSCTIVVVFFTAFIATIGLVAPIGLGATFTHTTNITADKVLLRPVPNDYDGLSRGLHSTRLLTMKHITSCSVP